MKHKRPCNHWSMAC